MAHPKDEIDIAGDLAEYRSPEITDYGTLLDLTEAGHVSHSDIPHGSPDTAYPSY
jgi:hypothetical protein